MSIAIRNIVRSDEARWRELWDAYTRFYQKEPSEEVTRHTWSRIMDADSPVRSIVAETETAGVVGIANYVVHETTSKINPICCLQDLFVAPAHRSAGIGKRLIDQLVAEMKSQGWSRLYWHTRENNYGARSLYDKVSAKSGFIRYVIDADDT